MSRDRGLLTAALGATACATVVGLVLIGQVAPADETPPTTTTTTTTTEPMTTTTRSTRYDAVVLRATTPGP
jgi:hypothetical protein